MSETACAEWARARSTRTTALEPDVMIRGARGNGRAPTSDPCRIRRIIDVVGASILLIAAAPLLCLLAAATWIGSGRPIFFRHIRVGLDGRPFPCWKFRTMAVNAEERLDREPDLKQRHIRNGYKLPTRSDPRVTRVGAWLRRTYLDELPQLYNVLRGTMSLVGPRPIVGEELERHYGAEADLLLSIKPGLFGEWTSRGRNRPDHPERGQLELDYVRNRTVGRDLRIVLRSIPTLLRGHPES